jgi:hypothetical protein
MEVSAMSDQYVLLSTLAQELGLDKSSMRKYIIKHGFGFAQLRTAESRGQLVLALTLQDAEAIRELRQHQGFTLTQAAENGHGWFYIVQVVPDLDPLRVKLGFATDPVRRLEAHRTVSPTAQILKTWRCRLSWETVAIQSISRVDCQPIGGEVFTCTDLDALVQRADAFFALMPNE